MSLLNSKILKLSINLLKKCPPQFNVLIFDISPICHSKSHQFVEYLREKIPFSAP